MPEQNSRRTVAAVIAFETRRRARLGVEADPEGHAEAFAAALAEHFVIAPRIAPEDAKPPEPPATPADALSAATAGRAPIPTEVLNVGRRAATAIHNHWYGTPNRDAYTGRLALQAATAAITAAMPAIEALVRAEIAAEILAGAGKVDLHDESWAGTTVYGAYHEATRTAARIASGGDSG